MRVIVALSGGKASAYCVDWAFKRFHKKDIILYFNDTKWEHPDLYRFLNDLSSYYNHPITFDSDGRNPEQLFIDTKAIANNLMPFCSRILKAERLQKYYLNNDVIIFGIGLNEKHRAKRIIEVYEKIYQRKSKKAHILFPLIQDNIDSKAIDNYLINVNIEQPILYKLGFIHNNCSGGCVRAGKKQWKLLYEKLPEIYMDRERAEREVQNILNIKNTIFKDETLGQFRKRIESGELSHYYDNEKEENETECIGICSHYV